MGSPLRVLHVVVNMNRGGAETLIMNLYRNIDRTKLQFDFLTCKEGVFDSEITMLGGKIHRIPYISDVGHLQFVKELKNFFIKNDQYKIVHSHLDKMSGLVLRAAKQVGIPIRISHSHNTRSEGGPAARIYKWIIGKNIIPNSTNLMACSHDAAKWLFNRKSHASIILKNGIEFEKFTFSSQTREKVRENLKIKDGQFIIGHVGRFNHQKNHFFILDVFSKISEEIEDSLLILVGDGDLRPAIENKIQNLNLDSKVLLLGIRSDIDKLLQGFDLLIFPSLHEGLPVSLIEAQGSGLPCLIANHISKEVDLGFGLIEYASLSDIKIWSKKILELKSSIYKRDRGLKKIVQNEFDIKKSADFLEGYYLSVLR